MQYYGHREKLRAIGREGDLEVLNRTALRIARDVADRTGTLMAGNLSNTTVYQRDNPESVAEAESIFKVRKVLADFVVIVVVAAAVVADDNNCGGGVCDDDDGSNSGGGGCSEMQTIQHCRRLARQPAVNGRGRVSF